MSFRRIVRVPQVAKEPRTTRRLEDIMNADELTKLTTDALDQHSVGDASVGARLRLRDDMLATPARLATSRHLGSHSLRAAGLARSQRPDRLVAGRRGQLFRASDVWGSQTGPNPTDRAKPGSKRHVICDGRGVPLAVRLTGPTGTTHKKLCRSSMRFRLCRANEDDRGVVVSNNPNRRATTLRRWAVRLGRGAADSTRAIEIRR